MKVYKILCTGNPEFDGRVYSSAYGAAVTSIIPLVNGKRGVRIIPLEVDPMCISIDALSGRVKFKGLDGHLYG